MAEIRGTITDIVYSNDKNGYTIAEIMTEGSIELTLTGVIPFPGTGENIIAEGDFVSHPVYGQQFKAVKINRTLPSDLTAIYQFFCSGVIKGIGLATARRLVNSFGDEIFDILENSPERLTEIKGITIKKAIDIGNSFKKISSIRSLNEFIVNSGLDPMLGMQLYTLYGDNAVNCLLSNPYILIMRGLSQNFQAVDSLALKQGLSESGTERIFSSVLYILYRSQEDGHCYLPYNILVSETARLIGIDPSLISDGINKGCADGLLIRENTGDADLVYLKEMYDSEIYIASRLNSLANRKFIAPKGLSELIARNAATQMINYSDRQREALFTAAESGVMVLTGGPGTGKTTAIKGIIAMLEGFGCRVALAAPTGRAAKRMSELCDRESKTIHRLLEVAVDGSGMKFQRNIENPLEADAVIIDELSMLDISLMRSLLEAVKESARLIMIGDPDQLPPVGPGNLLSDIIASGRIKCIHLEEIFRQAKESNIIIGAHDVNCGKLPPLAFKSGDLFFIRRSGLKNISETIVDLVSNRLPNRMGINTSDIQVLLPNRKNEGGTEQLNPMLQAVLNPPDKSKRERRHMMGIFREGDRVMQTQNNYEIAWRKNDDNDSGMGIYNGDTGIILSIDNSSQTVVIRFDDKTAVYNFDMLDQLELSYAATVHKAQGSEYPVVIFGAGLSNSRLSTRNLLYTAMTRAKSMLIIVGREDVLYEMAGNNHYAVRYSDLRRRIADN